MPLPRWLNPRQWKAARNGSRAEPKPLPYPGGGGWGYGGFWPSLSLNLPSRVGGYTDYRGRVGNRRHCSIIAA